MTSYALLFTLAAIGISETVYLIRKRIAAEKPICPIGEGCANDILGLLFYIVASFIAAFLVIDVGPLAFGDFILKFSVAFGALLSLFFTYSKLKTKLRFRAGPVTLYPRPTSSLRCGWSTGVPQACHPPLKPAVFLTCYTYNGALFTPGAFGA